MKMRNEYDVMKGMLKTMRTLTESKSSNKVLREQEETTDSQITNPLPSEQIKDDITVINDVDVKLLSNDDADMELAEDQKEAISTLIDNFHQQVSQIVEFEPGMTMSPNQIRLDGTLTDEEINFVFIAGDESGVYINAEMLELEQDTATALEKLAKFNETFKTAMEPLIKDRNNN
jgi:hypothetical protein